MIPFLKLCLRHLAIGTLVGLFAGLLAGGLGSRLAMRITALMTEDALQGRLTEAQARVGEISLGGTFFLVFFSALLGVYGGILYRVLAAWLPLKTGLKGLCFGFLLVLLHGTMLIEGDNFDFTLFGSVFVNLAMFLLIPLAFGLLAAYAEAWLESRFPEFVFRPKAMLLYLPALLGALVFVLLLLTQIQALGSRGQSGIGAIEQIWLSLLMMGLILLTILLEPMLKRFPKTASIRLIVLALPALYGGMLLFAAIREIVQ